MIGNYLPLTPHRHRCCDSPFGSCRQPLVMARQGEGESIQLGRTLPSGNTVLRHDDPVISKTMPYHRYLQIKAAYKLCLNAEAKKDKEADDYDPAYKYQYIYNCLTTNVNWASKKAGDDLCQTLIKRSISIISNMLPALAAMRTKKHDNRLLINTREQCIGNNLVQ